MMNVETFGKALFALTLLGTMAPTGTADAASMFTVTDLGSGFSLQQDSSGTVHSVTSGDGSQTYAFEKSPVTSVDEKYQGNHAYGYNLYSMQNGPYQVGYSFDYGGGWTGVYTQGIKFPTFEIAEYGWGYLTAADRIPVNDMNSDGQVVGSSQYLISDPSNYYRTYAAFSDIGLKPHGFDGTYTQALDAEVTDNLNHYIPPDLGIYLTSAVKIDDLGRIIAEGTLNGTSQDFLLTPNGQPTPAPEPTTFVTLAVASVCVVVRRRMKHQDRESGLLGK